MRVLVETSVSICALRVCVRVCVCLYACLHRGHAHMIKKEMCVLRPAPVFFYARMDNGNFGVASNEVCYISFV